MKTLLRPLRFLLLALLPLLAHASSNDEKVMQEFNTTLRDLRQKIFATDNLEERMGYQKQMMELFERTLTQLSDEVRPLMAVSLKIVLPLQQQSADYLGLVSKFNQSGQGDPATLKAREEIPSRIAALEELEKQNAALLERINGMNERVEKALDEGKVSGAHRASFLAGYNGSTGRTIGPMKAIRTLDGLIFAQMKLIYRHLDEHWGKWQADDTGFKWQDEAAQKKCDEMLTELQSLIARETKAEQQLSTRM
ncbi:hypothetical protein [Oleiharenicola sp. Vm1]|uniref:hypothetical protein n=1 Tax=Oleiharenicola sp. Vm1 TaxID=3398393 RepID=UPI0039F4C6DA